MKLKVSINDKIANDAMIKSFQDIAEECNLRISPDKVTDFKTKGTGVYKLHDYVLYGSAPMLGYFRYRMQQYFFQLKKYSEVALPKDFPGIIVSSVLS